jgi:hypothetical protein
MESFSRKVKVEDRTFFILGVIHDIPGLKISEGLKRDIASILKDKKVLCEDGFSLWIPNSVSFGESDYFKFNKLKPNKFIYYFFKTLFSIPFYSKELKSILEISSLEEFSKFKESNLVYTSEPLGMNSLISKFGGGSLENPKKEFPLRIRRYLYEAKRILDYSKQENLQELNIVVGCAHEKPLEYLLNNKEVLEKAFRWANP